MTDILHLSVTFKLAYKLDIESYNGLKVIAVPFMPLYFPLRGEVKFPIIVWFFFFSIVVVFSRTMVNQNLQYIFSGITYVYFTTNFKI